jgi:integrase/recombinase XerD
LGTIKHFFRWIYNQRGKEELVPTPEWDTPQFVQIKKKKTKRLSPYSETEIWDKDELLTVIKYQPYLRNKAALTLFWDLDARNHEVTMLKIKIDLITSSSANRMLGVEMEMRKIL